MEFGLRSYKEALEFEMHALVCGVACAGVCHNNALMYASSYAEVITCSQCKFEAHSFASLN